MKRRLLLALALSALSLAAASWDGPRGPFTLYTVTFRGYFPGGFDTRPPSTPDATGISVVCSDPTVSAVRVTVTYLDERGIEADLALVGDISRLGWGGVLLPTYITESRIVRVKLTALRDGETY